MSEQREVTLMLPDDDERFEPDTDQGLSVGFQIAIGLVLIIGFSALAWFLFRD